MAQKTNAVVRGNSPRKLKAISFVESQRVYEHLQEIAHEQDRSVSWLIRKAIRKAYFPSESEEVNET